MKTKACERCGKEWPVDSYVKHDHRRPNPYVSRICNPCRRKQEKENRREPEDLVYKPLVLSLKHYETVGPDALWPRGRLFVRREFEADLKDGVWPTGLVVKNERGKLFIVEGCTLHAVGEQ